MYENIEESLEALFDEAIIVMQDFQKKTYEDTFKKMYEEHRGELTEFTNVCETSEDADAVIEQISNCIPAKVKALLDAEETKRKKEFKMLDYNMALVTFVTPVISYNRSQCCEKLAAKIVDKWNIAFPKFKLQNSTFENIEGGFKRRLCYVTTAVCGSLGKPDDCYELTLMREYRDQYLLKEAGREDLVKEYYDVAPTIVNRIDKMDNAKEVYANIWDTYLTPCIQLIEADEKIQCQCIYSDMVTELRKKYLYS